MSGTPKVAVLAYHKIGLPPAGSDPTWFYVPETTFRTQLETLGHLGWPVIDLASFLRGLDAPGTLPAQSALITFDDGYRSFTGEALSALRAFAHPSVLFVPTRFIGGSNTWDADVEPEESICDWPDLQRLSRADVAIEAHSASHPHFSELDAESLTRELQESKVSLESGLMRAVLTCAYPFGDAGSRPQLVDRVMSTLGYRAAFLYEGGVLDLSTFERYRLPRIPMGPDTDLRAELRLAP